MNERVKNEWCKALRSGEFEQIKSQLHDGQGYCAIGVLAALAMLEGVCTFGPGNVFDGRKSTASFNVMKWAEIDYDDEKDELKMTKAAGKIKFIYKGRETSIADLNDSGMSFQRIADIIEAKWRGL